MNIRSWVMSVIFSLGMLASAYADTTVFGMTLGKSTLDDFKKEYPLAVKKEVFGLTDEVIYSVPINEINFDGLKSEHVIFNQGNKLTAIILKIDKRRFDEIHALLSKKYKVSKKDVPFVGDRFVKYKSGEDVIGLNSPHLSFEMTLVYAERKFMDVFHQREIEENRKKDADEFEKL